MEESEELKKTFLEEFDSARLLKDKGRMKSAVILLSKALFALCDYIIIEKHKRLPKNHSERFRILEKKEPKIYSEVNRVWSGYTDTYSKPSDKESYALLRQAINHISENERLDQEIKAIIEKQ